MTQEQFNNIITPKWECRDHQEKMLMKATMGRTMRLCIQYPEFAKVYYDSLPKATCDNDD